MPVALSALASVLLVVVRPGVRWNVVPVTSRCPTPASLVRVAPGVVTVHSDEFDLEPSYPPSLSTCKIGSTTARSNVKVIVIVPASPLAGVDPGVSGVVSHRISAYSDDAPWTSELLKNALLVIVWLLGFCTPVPAGKAKLIVTPTGFVDDVTLEKGPVAEPVPAQLPVSTSAASVPRQSVCAASPTTGAASISPLRYSRSQSPPSDAFPVRSSEAATSACVTAASASISASPSGVDATSQPYTRMSPSVASAPPQAENVSVSARSRARSMTSPASTMAPSAPWLIR